MKKITRCLNEWNAVLEALGQGKQSILIRKYKTNLNEFLLYPTKSYADKENYLNGFKDQFKPFVKENTFPKMENKKMEVKYLAKVENIIKRSTNNHKISNFNIWTYKHIKSYLGTNKAYI